MGDDILFVAFFLGTLLVGARYHHLLRTGPQPDADQQQSQAMRDFNIRLMFAGLPLLLMSAFGLAASALLIVGNGTPSTAITVPLVACLVAMLGLAFWAIYEFSGPTTSRTPDWLKDRDRPGR